MPYQHYTSTDFALDEKFQQWVLHPDEENQSFWSEWCRQHPQKQKEVAEATELIKKAGLSADSIANQAFLEVWNNLQVQNRKNERLHQKHIAFRYAYIAAVLGAFILVATFLLWKAVPYSGNIVYKTNYGQVKKVVLPDGSKVILNANSIIRFSEDGWAKQEIRQVYLEGEAFFEIVKTRDKRKFIVKTPGEVAVSVLGTEFNIKTRRKATSVFLESGKVNVQAPGGENTLSPGQLASYNAIENKVQIGPAKKENQLGWKNNLFIFDDTPLANVAEEIEDNFGFKVIITDDSLIQKRFTAKVPSHTPGILLKVLSETLQIDVTRQHNYIIVQPKTTGAN